LFNAATGNTVKVDVDDNIIVSGSFYGTVDFDPGPGTTTLSAVGTSEVFITKLNSAGDFVWVKKFGNFTNPFYNVEVQGHKCDIYGNIYSTGWFNGVCDFDPGATVFNLSSGSAAAGFVTKIDSDGNFIWAKRIGSDGNILQPWGIEIDTDNNVYTTGAFLGTQDFDPGNNTSNLTSNGGFDAFILKLNSQGDFVWAKSAGNSNPDFSFDVIVDNNNMVYTIGEYSGLVDFDPGPATFPINLYDEAVLSKFDAS